MRGKSKRYWQLWCTFLFFFLRRQPAIVCWCGLRRWLCSSFLRNKTKKLLSLSHNVTHWKPGAEVFSRLAVVQDRPSIWRNVRYNNEASLNCRCLLDSVQLFFCFQICIVLHWKFAFCLCHAEVAKPFAASAPWLLFPPNSTWWPLSNKSACSSPDFFYVCASL